MPSGPLEFPEPSPKRCNAFFDGQNLFYCAKEAFGYKWPNYDPIKLAQTVCANEGWELKQIFFYTGVPSNTVKPHWNQFWNSKLAVMGTRGVVIYSRELKYSNQPVKLPDGSLRTELVGREKGIDIRIALDVVRLARKNEFDVALIFSQDQDLSEVADEVRAIAQEQNRWIKIASAFPLSPTSCNTRGINGTDWIIIDKTTYDACIDPMDYRLKK
jgi:uncharacterized LabA/DUF88 family protein